SDVCSSDLEEDGAHPHRGGGDQRGDDDEVVELVHLLGEGGGLLGQEQQRPEELVHVRALPLNSRLQSVPSSPASANATSSEPPFTMPFTTQPYRRAAGSYWKQTSSTRSSAVPTLPLAASTSESRRSRGEYSSPYQ